MEQHFIPACRPMRCVAQRARDMAWRLWGAAGRSEQRRTITCRAIREPISGMVMKSNVGRWFYGLSAIFGAAAAVPATVVDNEHVPTWMQ